MTAPADIVTLADEVTADLNARQGQWSAAFKAARVYYPKWNLEELAKLQVQVFPFATRKTRPVSRKYWEYEFDIDIVLAFMPDPKAGDQPETKYDPLQLLVQNIADMYDDARALNSGCVFVAASIGGGSDQPYSHEAIESKNAFVSGVRMTFRKWR